MSQQSVAIIGAGFSGSLLSLRLQEVSAPGTRIHLIERSGKHGVGVAYATDHPEHRLNVPAERMSAFPEAPDDFLDWARGQPAESCRGVTVCKGSFLPRSLYGSYIRERLQHGVKAGEQLNSLELHNGEVTSLRMSGDRLVLSLASGQRIIADRVVLATGYATPSAPFDVSALQKAGLWRESAWAPDALANMRLDAPVLLVGTGLTMVDAVITLLDAGHVGPIHALSRRGLLPGSHLELHAPAYPISEPLPSAPLALLRRVRQEVANAAEMGVPWQAVIDALRPHVRSLWQGFGVQGQSQFLRHVQCRWDVHRHRVAPEIAARIHAARASGRLQIHTGRVLKAETSGDAAQVTYSPRGQDTRHVLEAARVVNCSGPPAHITRADNTLVQALLRDGLARPDPHHLGLDVTETGAVIDRSGRVSNRLFALGPLTKGLWWEITAVPDIRQQCLQVAQELNALASRAPQESKATGYIAGPGHAVPPEVLANQMPGTVVS